MYRFFLTRDLSTRPVAVGAGLRPACQTDPMAGMVIERVALILRHSDGG